VRRQSLTKVPFSELRSWIVNEESSSLNSITACCRSIELLMMRMSQLSRPIVVSLGIRGKL